jgi:hypothetical protein
MAIVRFRITLYMSLPMSCKYCFTIFFVVSTVFYILYMHYCSITWVYDPRSLSYSSLKGIFTLNIIAYVRHARLYERAVRAMRKKLKLSSDVGDPGNKTCKRGYGGACGGVWRNIRCTRAWSLELGDRFCVSVFGRNLASVAVKMFSRLVHFLRKFYKLCVFSAI